METDSFPFSESCESFALDTPFLFISSYPGLIVFGKVNKKGFKKGQFFKFGIFECYKLYLAIIKILSFLTSSDKTDKALILQSDEHNYFWIGTTVLTNNKEQKIIKLGIEKDDNITFEIQFVLKNFQFFFNGLSKVIRSCLCLREVENNLILFLLEKNPKEYASIEDIHNCVETFIKMKNINENNRSHLINVISYYKEIMIILFKLKSLEHPNFRREIVSNLII